MALVSCSYGKDGNYIDVTDKAKTLLSKDGLLDASNRNFGDPLLNVKKELKLRLKLDPGLGLDPEPGLEDRATIVITEGDSYSLRHGPLSQKDVILKCYYHIFVTNNPAMLNIIDEQINTLLYSSIYNKFTVINCCLSGNDKNHYNHVLRKLSNLQRETGGKIKLLKAVFGDTTYERFTLDEMRHDPDINNPETNNKTFILYIHSKGATRKDVDLVAKWRRCLMHFLVVRATVCIEKFLNDNYDTIGICYFHNYGFTYADGVTVYGNHFGGNFWWVKGSYMQRVLQNHIIGPRYYDTEQLLFKEQPKFCNLYDWDWSYAQFEEHNYIHL